MSDIPEGFSRTEKYITICLLLVTTVISSLSLYFGEVQSARIEEQRVAIEQDRIAIEQTLLGLEQERLRQTDVLQQLEIAVRGQQQSRNQIDQRIRLLELIQSTRPNVEVFSSTATNTEGLASVGYCFVNRSDFSAIVSVERIEFTEIGALGARGRSITPYLFGSFSGLGELSPGNATMDVLSFRLQDFDRANSNFKVTAKFRFSALDFFTSEMKALAEDLQLDVGQLNFSFTYTLGLRFTDGYFGTNSLRPCQSR